MILSIALALLLAQAPTSNNRPPETVVSQTPP